MSRSIKDKRPELPEMNEKTREHLRMIALNKEREYWIERGYHLRDVEWYLQHHGAKA